MSDWRESAVPDRTGFGLGDLQDGERVAVQFLDDGRTVDTEHGEAAQWGVTVIDAPDGMTDMNDETLQTVGDADGDPAEYHLMSSSTRLAYALVQASDDLTGEKAVIEAVEGADSVNRSYVVDIQ